MSTSITEKHGFPARGCVYEATENIIDNDPILNDG